MKYCSKLMDSKRAKIQGFIKITNIIMNPIIVETKDKVTLFRI